MKRYPVQNKARRFQNREARRDTQKQLADDLILAVYEPDHPEVIRIKAERKQKNPATPKRDGVGQGT
jgi:O-methyltransferase involved in polyketide biosynthesis